MRKLYAFAVAALVPAALYAQSPFDAYQISQSDLKGTARFMGMAGAFGALGGDLSTLSQNPAGIGVYRSSEVGFTLDLDCQQASATAQGFKTTKDQTRFYLNNIGGVATLRLGGALRNLNIGFTYNKAASFERRYAGGIPSLPYSLSNYIAGVASTNHVTEADVKTTSSFDPYNPNDGGYAAPWITILGYDSYLIDPEGTGQNTEWYGQFGDGTQGSGVFQVNEKGHLDEYNIAIGGNFNDKVFWGMNFDIVSMDYRIQSVWGENLTDAYVYDPTRGNVARMDARWALRDKFRLNGTGFNYQLGVIVKPIQELRIGFAFHTPTWYNLTETFYNERVDYDYPFNNGKGYAVTNNGDPNTNELRFQSPWKLIASVAGVIGSKFIVSMDYEWNQYEKMKFSNADSYNYFDPYDPWDPWQPWNAKQKLPGAPYSYNDDPIGYTNDKISTISKNTSTIRIGAEYRVIPEFSVRVGYSYTSSPVTSKAKDNLEGIPGAGVMTNYRLDNSTNYITAGVGYRHKGFYIDAAYVWKHISSEYYPFSPDTADPLTVANSKLSLNNSQVVLSMGYKF